MNRRPETGGGRRATNERNDKTEAGDSGEQRVEELLTYHFMYYIMYHISGINRII